MRLLKGLTLTQFHRIFSRSLSKFMEIGARIIVRGVVQGVGFRYFVYTHATILGIVGFASNLENGDVLVEAEGDRSLIEEFIKKVKVGPKFARVTDLNVEWKAPEYRFKNFIIR